MDYSDYHFEAEERWMLTHGFPQFDEHVRQHEDFFREMADFHQDLVNGNALVAAGVLTYLKDWLINHILNADTEFYHFEGTVGLRPEL